VTDDYHDYIGLAEFWWNHGLISDETYQNLKLLCSMGSSEHPSNACNSTINMAYNEQGNIDPYSIYTPTCKKKANSKHKQLRAGYVRIPSTIYNLL
jgi:serine carboxypeptidase-like clade II